MKDNQKGTFKKLGLRRAQAISVVNAAIILTFSQGGTVERAEITLGSIAPTVIHAVGAQEFLVDRVLTAEIIEQAAQLARDASSPIDDIRG